MSVRIIVGLVVILLVILFAVQNTEPVALHLLFWEVSAPAAMMVALAFAFGMFVGALFFWTEQWRAQRQHPIEGLTSAPAGSKKKDDWWW